ncbi:MAG: Uma2 family endonuclease, partial [Polyangiaceae bacterium]|nr:Uma2 family endonuclease [Polyangiaceae bacterium]
EAVGAEVDWSSWYLTDEEDVGSSGEQTAITQVVLSSLNELSSSEGFTNRLCSTDQFFAWRPDEPLVRVSPDIYVLDDPPSPPLPKSWQTWLPGHRPPRFAIEIVSDDWVKDYEQNPRKYLQLGCPELVIFDPDAVLGAGQGQGRVPLQVYRRDTDGAYVRVYAGSGPAHSKELDIWLVARREGPVARLRLSHDEEGTRIVPTEAEARRVEAEARKAAEARIQELEEKLRRAGVE